jgi:hypothetical protein
MLPTHSGGRGARGRGAGRPSRTVRALVNVAAVLLPLAALTMLFGGSARLASFIAGHHARSGPASGAAAHGGGSGSGGSARARADAQAGAVPSLLDADAAGGAPGAGAADSCPALVAEWVAASDARAAARAAAPKPTLTYFLHVPRTAGRTLFFCALKPAFAPSERCERAYDHLRLDPHAPQCGLLSSHDDFRLVESFPGGGAVLITQLRDPVDRLLSAYEFAAEVASRGVGQRAAQRAEKEKARAAEAAAGRAHDAAAAAHVRTDTTQVWPWNVLVPMMAEDMDARAAARDNAPPPRGSAYNGSLIMPLADFAAHPFVADLLHNGATFQLLGLTNNSVSAEGAPGADAATAAALRACVRAGGPPAAALAAAAQRRLADEMDVVLLKDRLYDSVATVAAALGRPLSGASFRTFGDEQESGIRAKLADIASRGDPVAAAAAREEADTAARGNVALGAAFARCAAQQREKAAERRVRGLSKLRYDDGSSIAFRRDEVPADMLYTLAAANGLDVSLHAAGVKLFNVRRAALAADGKLERLKPDGKVSRYVEEEQQR